VEGEGGGTGEEWEGRWKRRGMERRRGRWRAEHKGDEVGRRKKMKRVGRKVGVVCWGS